MDVIGLVLLAIVIVAREIKLRHDWNQQVREERERVRDR